MFSFLQISERLNLHIESMATTTTRNARIIFLLDAKRGSTCCGVRAALCLAASLLMVSGL